nr:MAG TPA: hypothetical protein [Caudoviricetes sp.]
MKVNLLIQNSSLSVHKNVKLNMLSLLNKLMTSH